MNIEETELTLVEIYKEKCIYQNRTEEKISLDFHPNTLVANILRLKSFNITVLPNEFFCAVIGKGVPAKSETLETIKQMIDL